MSQHPLTTQIIKLIEQKSGLLLREEHREADTHRAIKSTVEDLSLRDVDALYYQLQQHDSKHPIWQTLLQSLTIGETYFFRNEAHFSALRHEILPQMIAHKRQRDHRWLRIWSAGCATGEEIYSLAILIRELLPDYKDWSIYLLGTDINEEYLEQARQGIYRGNSFRSETPESLCHDWFTRHGNSYKLDASIRNMVIFQSLNLVTDPFPSTDATLQSMDMILCQNVTIYFERPVTERIQTSLVETLADDGWLILGHSEPLFIKSPHLGLRNFPNAVVFQRQPAPIVQTEVPDSKRTKQALPKVPLLVAGKPTTDLVQPIKQAHDLCEQAQQAADNQSWEQAILLLDELLQLHPLYAYAHYLRGLIYMERMDFNKALGSLRQAMYCNSNFILAHYTLGELYNRTGHPMQAKREWQLTQNLLSCLEPENLVPHSTDLSVEMLSGLVAMQLVNGGAKA